MLRLRQLRGDERLLLTGGLRGGGASLRVALICGLVTLRCAGGPTPEELIADLVDRGREAAERGDMAALAACVASDYSDAEGHDRRTLLARVAGHVSGNRSTYLLTRVRSIEFPAPHAARVKLLVAAASREIDDLADLREVSADVLNVELELAEERPGEWKVRGASWSGAGLADVLGAR